MRTFDVPGSYLQGVQGASEQMVLRPPEGFRKNDERGVEILWLMNSPLYDGQGDAGTIWNRTINEYLESELGFTRSHHDPCVSFKLAGRMLVPLHVDDGRFYYYADDDETKKVAEHTMHKLSARLKIEFGTEDPRKDYFLGGNRLINQDRSIATTRMNSYVDLMVGRYADGDVSTSKFPVAWSHAPSDDSLQREWEKVMSQRSQSSAELMKRYGALFESLLHAVKYRPEIAATQSLLGSCLTFPTDEMHQHLLRVLVYLGGTSKLGTTFNRYSSDRYKVRCFADSNWTIARSTTGYCIQLCGGTICGNSHRQHCITMSSTEAELVALAKCAIELIYLIGVLTDIGLEIKESIEACTDNKGAYDLCHRYSSAQHSRHVDRKIFKMRELRGKGTVTVRHIPTEKNPADVFTKILTRSVFENHRNVVLNFPFLLRMVNNDDNGDALLARE